MRKKSAYNKNILKTSKTITEGKTHRKEYLLIQSSRLCSDELKNTIAQCSRRMGTASVALH